jgi:hypothetical protein
MLLLNCISMKPSIWDSSVDLSDNAFVWASRNVRCRKAVEEFVSCGVWPLAAGVSFEHVKVDLTPVSKLEVPLARFPLCREDEEDDARFLARVEQEARNIVGSYTHMGHKACLASLPNNHCLNRVLKVAGVAYAPLLVPVSAEVLKKRKVDAIMKALAKWLKVPEKNGAEPAKASRSCASGGSKRPSGVNILLAKSVKLSKGIVPNVIASAAATCITLKTRGPENFLHALGSRAGDWGRAIEPCPERRRLL